MDMNQTAERPDQLLDGVCELLRGGHATLALRELFDGLGEIRTDAPLEAWASVRDAVTAHDLRGLIHEDPMTRRSFEKPRGYAGDAVLLDYIYRLRGPEGSSDVGRAVYDYAVGRPAARAVRHRCEWLAHSIDRAADRVAEHDGSRARILSVACGHLREAAGAASLRGGGVERLVALDADAESLAEVGRLELDCVERVEMSVGRLLGRASRMGEFDLSYSAGLYDYLEPGLARRLTACLFGTLAPGGRLLVSNFLPTVADAGYMETFMGWDLIYRSEQQLAELAADLPADQVGGCQVYSDPFGAIAYLEVERRR